jgi:ribonucleotide reductase alpha subunit
MEDLFIQEPAIASDHTQEVKQIFEKENEGIKQENSNSMEQESERKIYSHEEVVEASIGYFKGDELAARVWANKYALKDSYGNLYEKTPDDMHRRLAKEIHRIEKKYRNPLSEELIYERFQVYCSSGRADDRDRQLVSDSISFKLFCNR